MDKKATNKSEQLPEQLTFKILDFEGPLDLLLHLIKQNEMDIYDIQMTEITSQYIDYLHHMEKMELDIAGEYFVTAAMLLNIKSAMLLPNQPAYDDEDQADSDYFEEDPRERLVQQLLMHQLFQEAATGLQEKYAQRAKHFEREPAEIPADAQLGQLSDEHQSIMRLEKAFNKLLSKHRKAMPLKRQVSSEKYSLKTEIQNLDQKLKNASGPIIFDDLFSQKFDLELYVTIFLALLELVKRGAAQMMQKENLGQIQMISGDKNPS